MIFPPPPATLATQALTAALVFWDRQGVANPCPAGVEVTYDDLSAIPHPEAPLGEVAGAATPGTCRIMLSKTVDWANDLTVLCTTLTHEDGHLRGVGHQGYGIMNPGTRWYSTPECDAFAKRYAVPPKVVAYRGKDGKLRFHD